MIVKLLTSQQTLHDMEYNAAFAALTCRANTDKEFVASEVLKRIINAGHESILEHINLTYSVQKLSRACLQELARHRHISLSVESTRHTLREKIHQWNEVQYPSGDGDYRIEFTVRFARDYEHYVEISYRPDSSVVTIDRSRSGQADCITKRRSIRVRDRRGSINLRILIDRWSAEVFINGGEQVMSLTYYTPPEATGITFSAEGSAVMDIVSFKMQ